jgi:hypothetical protein
VGRTSTHYVGLTIGQRSRRHLKLISDCSRNLAASGGCILLLPSNGNGAPGRMFVGGRGAGFSPPLLQPLDRPPCSKH